ncbi:hypothetical protein [Nocardiopsis dassonvillei]|uniref:hypothetical protein n=1 Tax=Nocardiopsis dassonvillei TaxID=2014 RepID=UPI003632D0B0
MTARTGGNGGAGRVPRRGAGAEKALREEGVDVRALALDVTGPGYCATGLDGDTGTRTAERGARVGPRPAILPGDGPDGGAPGPPGFG